MGSFAAKFAVLLCFASGIAAARPCFAKPLTVEAIKSARKIGIMPGTFDPVTDGHIAAAIAAAEQGGLDMVILTPQENPHKNPIARELRLKMASLAAAELPKIYTADDGALHDIWSKKWISGIVRTIRSINPSVEIDLVAGSDFASNQDTDLVFSALARPDRWIVLTRGGSEDARLSRIVRHQPHQVIEMRPLNVSSSGVKTYLQSHPELYSHPPAVPIAIPGLNPEVAEYILRNRYYESPPHLSLQRRVFQCILNHLWRP